MAGAILIPPFHNKQNPLIQILFDAFNTHSTIVILLPNKLAIHKFKIEKEDVYAQNGDDFRKVVKVLGKIKTEYISCQLNSFTFYILPQNSSL